tara:strand:- start:314 stop:514 length:201 start_codon:yes stop_codon:yes gene_type:complete
MPGRKMSKYMAKGGKFMAKRGGKFMAKRGGKFMAKTGGKFMAKGKTPTIAQIRSAAKKKGYKLVKA